MQNLATCERPHDVISARAGAGMTATAIQCPRCGGFADRCGCSGFGDVPMPADGPPRKHSNRCTVRAPKPVPQRGQVRPGGQRPHVRRIPLVRVASKGCPGCGRDRLDKDQERDNYIYCVHKMRTRRIDSLKAKEFSRTFWFELANTKDLWRDNG